jgi:hypothetical protein
VRIQSAFLTVVLAVSSGCSEWPRFANIPASGVGTPNTTDPRSLVDIDEWDEQVEAEPNDSPVKAQELLLDMESGSRAVAINGVLDGIGWSDLGEAEPITSEGCNEVSYERTYPEAGDYLFDLDFYVVEVAEAGLLCARLVSEGETEIGWDLTGYPLDSCDVPTGVFTKGDSLLGFGLSWPAGGWAQNVEAGERIGVLVAGYAPNDGDHAESYSLGLSLLRSDGSSEIQVCPFLPTETQE